MARTSLRRLRFLLSLLLLSALVPPAAFAQGGFQTAIRPPARNPAAHAVYQQWLRESRTLELLADAVNRGFVVPERAWMVVDECGQANAFWDPQQRTIILCYEMVRTVFEEFRYDGLSQEQFGTAVASTVTFILMHEMGHALVDLLDLPITGREEDVVDQFAALTLGSEDPNPALWAAEFQRTHGDFGDLGVFRSTNLYHDEHGFDLQRFYNILCWTYGKDPRNRTAILQVLPQSRAARCPSEYRRLYTSWERILAPHVRQATAGSEPSYPIAGRWEISEQIGDVNGPLYCDSRIAFTATTYRETFAAPFQQVGTCTIDGRTVDNPARGQLAGGRVTGAQVYFRMETCVYTGTFQGGSVIVGTLSCNVAQADGSTIQVNGVWRAVRR